MVFFFKKPITKHGLNNQQLLNDLYLILEPSQHYSERNFVDFKLQLSKYLCNQYGISSHTERLERILTNNSSLLLALKKYKVINEALGLLHNTEKQYAIRKFIDHHLTLNQPILVTPRQDSGIHALVKGLGVAVVTFLSVGMGSYYAYNRLFVQTHGGEYLENISSVEKNNSLRP